MKRFIKSSVGVDDHVIGYFKRDVPCFQFTGFQAEDKAGNQELTHLLSAIVQVADWAAAQCANLSDQYPAYHDMKPQGSIEMAGVTRIALDRRDPSVYITVAEGYCVVPAVWYNAGSTQVQWGRLESAVREAIRVMG